MTRLRNRSESSSQGNTFSFIAPFAIALVILILVIKYLFSPNVPEANAGSFMTVTPQQDQSEIYIHMSGDSKKRIEGATKMYVTDSKLTVTTGEAEAVFEGTDSKLFLDKGGELKYEWTTDMKQTVVLENAFLWAESTKGDVGIGLKNFSVKLQPNSVVIVSQNAIASNIFVLKGSALVENTATKSASATVGVGQQLTVLRNDITSANFQLAGKIEPLSDFIKTTDLFIKHNGASFLTLPSESASGTTTASSGSIIVSAKGDMIISSPEDESTIDASEVTIEGNIINTNIVKITMNDKEVSLNRTEKSFIFKDFPLTSATNNIVYKAYDSEGGLIKKGILTLYSSKKTAVDVKKPTVTSYPISDKDFKIISPVGNPYKTTDDIVRIEGRVNKGVVKFITVNDFRLSKFAQLTTTWYYFANKDYGTMNDGINLYTIRYYWVDDNLLSTNLFTIVKEAKETEKIETATGTTATGSTEG